MHRGQQGNGLHNIHWIVAHVKALNKDIPVNKLGAEKPRIFATSLSHSSSLHNMNTDRLYIYSYFLDEVQE
jgi:hypothetical protein